ncbi:MAG TPA: thiosulfate oxidation carrier protein SoxY [Rhodocyclaceae bacterium]
MDRQRRRILAAASGAGIWGALATLGFVLPRSAQAAGVFEARTLDQAFALLGAEAPQVSDQVVIVSNDTAENGDAVPVGIRSLLPKSDLLALFVDTNPNPLVACYEISEPMLPEVNMRVRMGASAKLVALVRAEGRWYRTSKEIKYISGSCGI